MTHDQQRSIAERLMGWTVEEREGCLFYHYGDGSWYMVPTWTEPAAADEALLMWLREGRRCTLRGGGRVDGSRWFQAELQCQREPWRNSYGTGRWPAEAIGEALAQWVGV